MAQNHFNTYDNIIKPKLHLIADWSRNGVNQDDIAEKLGISRTTLIKYKQIEPDLFNALKNKEETDSVVENTLYKTAVGFHEEESVTEYDGNGQMISRKVYRKYYPPNPMSIFAWLNNRRPDKWRKRQEVTISQEGVSELQELIESVKKAVPVNADVVDLK